MDSSCHETANSNAPCSAIRRRIPPGSVWRGLHPRLESGHFPTRWSLSAPTGLAALRTRASALRTAGDIAHSMPNFPITSRWPKSSASHPHLSATAYASRSIPEGLCLSTQGCEERATHRIPCEVPTNGVATTRTGHNPLRLAAGWFPPQGIVPRNPALGRNPVGILLVLSAVVWSQCTVKPPRLSRDSVGRVCSAALGARIGRRAGTDALPSGLWSQYVRTKMVDVQSGVSFAESSSR